MVEIWIVGPQTFVQSIVTQKISETVSSCLSSFRVFGHLFVCLVIFSSGEFDIEDTIDPQNHLGTPNKKKNKQKKVNKKNEQWRKHRKLFQKTQKHSIF